MTRSMPLQPLENEREGGDDEKMWRTVEAVVTWEWRVWQ
jgi:hypothetical protein